jgi:hypothetical protein
MVIWLMCIIWKHFAIPLSRRHPSPLKHFLAFVTAPVTPLSIPRRRHRRRRSRRRILPAVPRRRGRGNPLAHLSIPAPPRPHAGTTSKPRARRRRRGILPAVPRCGRRGNPVAHPRNLQSSCTPAPTPPPICPFPRGARQDRGILLHPLRRCRRRIFPRLFGLRHHRLHLTLVVSTYPTQVANPRRTPLVWDGFDSVE